MSQNKPQVPEMFFSKATNKGTDRKGREMLKVAIAPEDMPRFVDRVKESIANGNGMNLQFHIYNTQYGPSSFMIAKKRLTKEQAQAEMQARAGGQAAPVQNAQPAVQPAAPVAPQTTQGLDDFGF